MTRTAALIEDVEFLLASGESAFMVIDVVGRSAQAITKIAYRHGKPEIARAFQLAVKEEKQKRRAA